MTAAACSQPGDSWTARSDVATAADTGGAQDATGGTSGPATAAAMCERWNADRAERAEGSWTGDAASCEAGAYLEPGPSNTLRQVNLYRWLAALPPVTVSAAKSADAQACAVMMHANGDIEHDVPAGWECRDEAAVEAAGQSNLATTPGVLSIDLYMTDQGVGSLGHRRWILSNQLGPIGVGSTDEFSCLHVIGGSGDAGRDWIAWPPPGFFPVQAKRPIPWGDLDAAGWSIQSPSIDFAGASVTVTEDGEPREVTTRIPAAWFGSRYALGITPDGWELQVGSTYRVVVTGVGEAIDYAFEVVDCGG